MNRRKKKWIAVLIGALSAVLLVGGASNALAGGRAPVSPALEIIASDLSLIKSGLCGEPIRFEASDFEQALGVDGLDAIVIRSLPSATAGKLMLGSLEVMKNQTISSSNLGDLRFIPTGKGVSESTFVFSAGNDYVYAVTCTLHVLAEKNAVPTAVGIDSDRFSLHTYRNIAIYGKLPMSDPEGDALTFEIVSSPKKGLLVLSDKNSGEFVYTPTKNYSGSDKFCYVVTDCYGNRSEVMTMSIKVTRSEENTVFADLIGHPAHYSAIRLSDAGIMRGVAYAGEEFFSPDMTVTRAEFLVMTMMAAGIRVDTDTKVSTVFQDDKEIPAAYRPYVAVAYENGYISGSDRDDPAIFDPNGTVTRAEAAVMMDNILDADVPVVKPVFADKALVPSWAEDAIASLYALGILDHEKGYILPTMELTRAEVAMMLSAFLDV